MKIARNIGMKMRGRAQIIDYILKFIVNNLEKYFKNPLKIT